MTPYVFDDPRVVVETVVVVVGAAVVVVVVAGVVTTLTEKCPVTLPCELLAVTLHWPWWMAKSAAVTAVLLTSLWSWSERRPGFVVSTTVPSGLFQSSTGNGSPSTLHSAMTSLPALTS